MKRKIKPVRAGGKTRVNKLDAAHDTHYLNHFQCPRCQLSGNANLFQPGWPERLHELIARYPGLGVLPELSSMDFQDARFLYNWLLRHEG